MKTALVTGANRGIGFEFVNKLSDQGYQVVACCRSPARAAPLQQLALSRDIDIVELDITSNQQCEGLLQRLEGKPIDRVILNAGIYGDRGVTVGAYELENLQQVFMTNTFATSLLADKLIPNVLKSEEQLLVAITSKVGSISDNQSGQGYAYRGSKCALNMIMYSMAVDLKETAIKILLLHPGYVKTEMTGSQALITPEESVAGMMDILAHHDHYPSGTFIDYKKDLIAW